MEAVSLQRPGADPSGIGANQDSATARSDTAIDNRPPRQLCRGDRERADRQINCHGRD
jgi:hypothetical protein